MPVRGVFYRNALPKPQRRVFLGEILSVPHPSEVPIFFFEIADQEGPLSVITGLLPKSVI